MFFQWQNKIHLFLILLIFLCVIVVTSIAIDSSRRNNQPQTVRVPILVYHNIHPAADTAKGELFVTPEIFAEQLAYLQKTGYTTISFDILIDFFSDGTLLPPKPVLITFDDSWGGQYMYALPLLKKYGQTAAFFIWSGMVGKKHFLTWNQIREIAVSGMEIGGHSASHLHLTDVMDSRLLEEEIVADKKNVEKKTGATLSVFSYPYGEYDDRIIDVVKRAGYRAARTVKRGNAHKKSDLYSLKSFVIQNNSSSLINALSMQE